MLAAAHGFERFGHLAPCALCHTQRQVYWAAGAIGLAGALMWRRGAQSRLLFAVGCLLGVVFLAGAGVAGFHTGVELGVFPAPETCTAAATGPLRGGDLWDQLSGPLAVPSCDKVAWSFLGLSMAAWNGLVSLALAVASLLSAFRLGRPWRAAKSGAPA